MKDKKILFVASECAPFIKVGGLADVIGSLPKVLKELGADISVILPYYENIIEKNSTCLEKEIKIFFDGKDRVFSLWKTHLPKSKVPLLLIKNNRYFSGEPYSTDLKSQAKRFLFFSKAVAKIVEIKNFKIVHCHDWHTSLIPFLLKEKRLKTILTIHNLAFQGVFQSKLVNRLLGTSFNEVVNCMKKGIEDADAITTVSPNYSKEILSPKFGFGLEKILRKRKKDLVGIINGIDPTQFNPETDPYITANYSFKEIEKKEINKENLQKECFGIVNKEIPVIGMITRIAEQKGFDLIEKILPKMMKENIQFIVLGKGVKRYEDMFKVQAKKNPNKMFIKIGFDENLAHRIYAGTDIFLMPSHFEPCGLGQMIAMKYGSIPVVSSVGGLKDTVIPFEKKKATGFMFRYSSNFWIEVSRALKIFKNKLLWSKIQKNGMVKDFSWKNSAQRYMRLYLR